MLKRYPLVTIIVLCYKKFDYIYQAIDSILNQDYPFIELIIADDASENFPENKIQGYIETNKKSNIVNTKILINEINLGTVKNLNNALKAGSGEYYMILSGDDVFYEKSTIQRIVERFEETGCEVLTCRRLKCTEREMKSIRMMPNNAYLQKIKNLNTSENQFRAFALGYFYEMASGAATYFSRKHFEKWGYYDESYTLWEDGQFYIQYTRAGNVITTAYDIVSIKYRDGGISSGNPNPKWIADCTRVIDFELYKNIDIFNKMDQRRISYLYKRKHEYLKFSKLKKIVFFIKYVDVIIYAIYYKYFCLIISKYESKMLKNN